MANNVGEWSTTAASNTSLGATSIEENIARVNGVNNAIRELMAQVKTAIGVSFQAYDADLAVIAALADPNADRILFWDDSAGAYAYLVPNLGISISGTNLNVTAGQGKHTVGVPAGAMMPATTSGCAALVQGESTTNDVNYKYLAFDSTSAEYAWFLMPTPKSYNASTVTMRAVWTHPATVTNFGVVWEFAIFAAANDDAIDTAAGTGVTVADTGGTTGDFYVSDDSSAVTPSNTAAKRDWLFCRVGRLPANGSDTMAVDAHLIGVELYYTTDASTDD